MAGYQTYKGNVTLGAGQKLGFKTGKGYYARGGSTPPAGGGGGTGTDPLAAMSPAQITNAIAGYTAGLPKPLTDAQIQTRAQGLIDPVVSSITDRVGATTKAGMGAISGYANSLANSLGGYGDSAKQIYGGAEQAQAAADAAESGAVRTGGSQIANELAGKIGQITSDPSAVASAMPDYNGAANAVLGTGSAALSALIGRGTAAQDYAAKLPGLARAQGASDLRDLGLSSQKNIADQVAQVEQKLPDLVQALRGQSDTRASNLASVRNDATKFFQSRNDAINAGKAKNAAAVTVAKTKADATVKIAQIKSSDQAAKDAKPSAALSGKTGYLVDSNGHWIPGTDGKPQVLPGFTMKNGRVVKTETVKAPVKTTDYPNLTKAQVLHLRAGISSAFYGVPEHKDANGKVTQNALPPVSYQEAITHAISAGYSRAAATRMANRFYMPGKRGRPPLKANAG